uniref:WAP domain-containing protein n=1 Tax=Acrobeloides nanus TaxID=290746 RepID=A0A914E2S0_9BILA
MFNLSCFLILLYVIEINAIVESFNVMVEDRRCSPCHNVKVNRRKEERCVYIQNCCKFRSSHVQCVVDPCLQFHTTCPRAAYCFQSNCNPSGCVPVYYDLDYNLIDSDKCRHFTLTNQTLNRAKPIVPTQRGAIPESAYHINLPTYKPSEISQKPGTCPSSTSEIIKACTSDCFKDTDCRRQEKCCWNGCARRCIASRQDPNNYFNLPIYKNQ